MVVSQVVLEIPEFLANLPAEERDRLIRSGVYEAARIRIQRLGDEIAESKQHIERFEARYGVAFSEFETELLSKLDTPEAHQDYNDWYFWQTVLAKNEKLLADLHKVKPD